VSSAIGGAAAAAGKAAQTEERLAPQLKQLKQATNSLEAVFFKQLLEAMRKSVPKTSFGDDPGSDTYQDMMDQALSETAGKSGALGISKLLYDQMSQVIRAQDAMRHGSTGPNLSGTAAGTDLAREGQTKQP